eukprot:TRINITY_DN5667_c0_g1_i2.p1 TRINITY_DN5667_c0_g1~~TRINITY_DN5667_c0_g1_i2.p1  ORF type:complete len:403 (+),score=66.28 TRINITY_DN5667_c0_g1_i2:210-1418(+)
MRFSVFLLSTVVLLASFITYDMLSAPSVKNPSILPPWTIVKIVNFLYRVTAAVERALIPPVLQIHRIAMSSATQQAAYAANELKIADLLHQHPEGLSPQRLAELAKVRNPDDLRRILRALVQIGLFHENMDGTFTNSRVSEYLRSDHPMTANYMMGHLADESYKVHGHLLESLLDGENAFKKQFGDNPWDYYGKNPVQRERFAKFMNSVDKVLGGTIIEGYASEWNKFSTIVDVGGSLGPMLELVLQENEHASGILFDLPEVIDQARQHERWAKDSSISKRTKLVSGSFFESVPVGDLYMLRHILHDWSDADSIKILKNVRKAIPSNGTLLLLEQVVPEAGLIVDDLMRSLAIDIQMLTVCDNGKERMASEWKELTAAAGFKINRFVQTKEEQRPLIECVPV